MEAISLDYKQFGNPDHETIVIVHGLFGLLDNWQTIAKALSDTHQVHILSLRNHGKSPWTESMNYDLMAEDISLHCKQHGLHDITLIGHSMGGKTAMNTARLFPELVSKLVVVDIAPKSYPPHHQHILDACKQMESLNLDSRQAAETIFKNAQIEPTVIQFMLKNLKRREDNTLGMKFNRRVLNKCMHHLMAAPESRFSSNLPTLFIRGGNSDYILSDDIEDIKYRYTKARIVTLKDTGHWLHAEKPADFIQIVKLYLTKQEQ